MDEINKRPNQSNEHDGVINNLTMRLKLITRLMMDRRVNPLIKLLPIGALLYLVIPDAILGPIDDVLVIWLGFYFFVELCPPEVVQEHMEALSGTIDGSFTEVVEVDEILEKDPNLTQDSDQPSLSD